jgi:hypothetical protein
MSDQGLQEMATPGDVRGSRLLTRLILANAKFDEFEFNSGHVAKRLPSRRCDEVGLLDSPSAGRFFFGRNSWSGTIFPFPNHSRSESAIISHLSSRPL